MSLDNGVPPALVFQPAASHQAASESARETIHLPAHPAPQRPESAEDLAFLPVRALAELLRLARYHPWS